MGFEELIAMVFSIFALSVLGTLVIMGFFVLHDDSGDNMR